MGLGSKSEVEVEVECKCVMGKSAGKHFMRRGRMHIRQEQITAV
jgi:hypothetical protein